MIEFERQKLFLKALYKLHIPEKNYFGASTKFSVDLFFNELKEAKFYGIFTLLFSFF